MINNLSKTELRVLNKMKKFRKPTRAVIKSHKTVSELKSQGINKEVLEILNNSKMKATKRLQLITQKLNEK